MSMQHFCRASAEIRIIEEKGRLSISKFVNDFYFPSGAVFMYGSGETPFYLGNVVPGSESDYHYRYNHRLNQGRGGRTYHIPSGALQNFKMRIGQELLFYPLIHITTGKIIVCEVRFTPLEDLNSPLPSFLELLVEEEEYA